MWRGVKRIDYEAANLARTLGGFKLCKEGIAAPRWPVAWRR